MNYKNYAAEDFMLDPEFQRWVQNNEVEQEQFWQQFLMMHPEKQPEVEQARHFILLANFREHLPAAGEQEEVWSRINASRRQEGVVRHLKPEGTRSTWRAWAAAVALLLAVSVGFYLIRAMQQVTYYAEYGQQPKNISLPDGSLVVLNANSTLTVLPHWGWGPSREVRLEGEAFFKITKKTGPGDKRFLVHTDALQVEVLGTEFNVLTRHKATQVVLHTGKVKLNLQQQGQPRSILMQPGDLLLHDKEAEKVIKKVVKPEQYTDWTRKQWVLENTTLRAVTGRIEETFGLKSVFQSPDIAREQMNGVVSIENLDDLLDALATINELKVKREGDTLYFSR